MNRWFMLTFSVLPLLVISGVLALHLWGDAEAEAPSTEGIEKEYAMYLEVRQKLLERYDGELEPRDLMNHALIGLADATGDRYTRLLPPVEAKNQIIGLAGAFWGIGSIVQRNQDGSVRLTDVRPGGGAAKAGLLNDDVIIDVDGVSILGQPWDATLARIKSEEENSIVRLTILRGGDPEKGNDPKARRIEFEVTRSRVVQYSVHDAHIEKDGDRRYGYVRVSDFNENTFDPLLKEAVAGLLDQGAEGLILDLRGNGGGRVNVAVALADAFLEQEDQLIVFTRSVKEANRKADYRYATKDAEAITSLPMVLLVDHNTASAAEIVTGALKDHGRAYVIGTRTFGKGVVQTIFKLKTDPAYRLNVTTTQYFTPLGRRVHKGKHGEPGGIVPNLTVRYRSDEAYNRIRARMRMREARFNREEIAADPERAKIWNAEDRMLQAAIDALAGRAVSVKKP